LGPLAIPPLIAIATDDTLHFAEEGSPAVWAPLHAIQILGELNAAEAVQPLLPLFTWDDDDWLGDVLADAFGRIGEPAMVELQSRLRDRGYTIWTRARVATALATIAEHHPALRADVVATLATALDPGATRTADDSAFNALVITDLLDLHATEAVPAIRRAFAEGRVDRSVVDEEDVSRELALSPPLPVARTYDRRPPGRATAKIGRNDPCWCGSGKKYKRCCGR
jgi:SEC-C motif/Protein of unknown function (DUF1186)